MNRAELIDAAAERTHGTAGDPLSRGEVEKVVDATVLLLAADGANLAALADEVRRADEAMGSGDDLGDA